MHTVASAIPHAAKEHDTTNTLMATDEADGTEVMTSSADSMTPFGDCVVVVDDVTAVRLNLSDMVVSYVVMVLMGDGMMVAQVIYNCLPKRAPYDVEGSKMLCTYYVVMGSG